MTLVKLEPFRGFEKLHKKFNDFTGDLEKGISFEIGGFNPKIDITEDEKSIFVYIEIPGMKKEDVKISVNEEKKLTIKGEKKKDKLSDERNSVRNERIYGKFDRTFILPEYANIESIEATFEDGILKLTISKTEPPKPKEINVEIK